MRTEISNHIITKEELEILVIESDKSTQKIHQYLIGKLIKNQIITFSSTRTALEYIRSKGRNTKFLVLSELYFPQNDFWSFLEESKDMETIFVAIVTCSVNRADKEKAFTYSNVVNYFIKPLRAPQIKYLKKEPLLLPFLLPAE